MNEKFENLSEYEKIKRFLEWAHLPYTATEIYEFFNTLNLKTSTGYPFTKSSIKTYLKDLSNTNQIQSRQHYGRRFNYYMANKDRTLKYMTLELVGFWVEHYDNKKLLDSTKKRLEEGNLSLFPKDIDSCFFSSKTDELFSEDIEEPEDLTISRKFALFQGTCIMDYHQIPIISSLYPFHEFKENIAIQPTINLTWLKELKAMLESNYSIILTSGLIYFNKENIEEIEQPKRREDRLINWKIRIPYYEHAFYDEKPGRMLDGQHRVIALDLINLERQIKGKNSIAFLGPITILIGDFSKNLSYEKRLLAKYFYLSNQSKNLPPLLIHEMTKNFLSELGDTLPIKEKFATIIDKMITLLEGDKKSPFYNEIDHESRQFNKLGGITNIAGVEIRLFSREAIKKMIDEMLKRNPFNLDKNRENICEEIEINMENWLDIIIDYFNALKCVFNKEWLEKNSIIRRNSGIYALGQLISLIWTHSLFRLERDERIKELIKNLSIWKDFDHCLDLSENSEFNKLFYSDSIAMAKNLYKTLEVSWISSTQDEQISIKSQMIIANAEQIWEQIKSNLKDY